jgi:serine protease Do
VQLGELEKVDQVSLGGGKRPPEGNAREFDELGLSLAPITDSLAKRFKLGDNVEGVVVAAIKQDGAAAEKGLRAGTVIVEVNQVKVKTPRDFAKELKKASKANQKSVLLLINEGGEVRFIGLKLDKK